MFFSYMLSVKMKNTDIQLREVQKKKSVKFSHRDICTILQKYEKLFLGKVLILNVVFSFLGCRIMQSELVLFKIYTL